MLTGRVIPFSEHPEPCAQAATSRLSIIQVGRDPELSRLRARVLSVAGHSVHSITPDDSTAQWKFPDAVRIWVFCHTVEFYELALMAVAVRRVRPKDKLLRMAGLDDVQQAPGLFDGLLEPIKGVEGLLSAVAELAAR